MERNDDIQKKDPFCTTCETNPEFKCVSRDLESCNGSIEETRTFATYRQSLDTISNLSRMARDVSRLAFQDCGVDIESHVENLRECRCEKKSPNLPARSTQIASSSSTHSVSRQIMYRATRVERFQDSNGKSETCCERSSFGGYDENHEIGDEKHYFDIEILSKKCKSSDVSSKVSSHSSLGSFDSKTYSRSHEEIAISTSSSIGTCISDGISIETYLENQLLKT